jgi:hypothetical protein
MMFRTSIAAALFLATAVAAAAVPEDYRVKPEAVHEFAVKPAVALEGRNATITFTSKGWCDCTVAIEERERADGKPARIVRHLVSGVLGASAPAPLQANSKSQTLTWDGKDDRGRYVSGEVNVRVSLGLQPKLERSLYWSPYKRSTSIAGKELAMQATPDGVYVFDGGQAIDHLRLLGHDGKYQRTVYPFPANRVRDVKGLFWHEFMQDGKSLPIKPCYQMCTLLTSGDNAFNINFSDDRYQITPPDPGHKGENTRATTDIAIANGRIAFAAHRLNRLATDGTSGGLPIQGPRVDLVNEKGFYRATDTVVSTRAGGYKPLTHLRPHRTAFSPDGKTLYLTRYIEPFGIGNIWPHHYWQHGVYRMAYEGDREPELFLGDVMPGTDERHFNMPADIVCDASGRLYVADCGNGRVQIYKADGTFLKSIPVEAPAQLAVSPKTGEIYVFSWPILPMFKQPMPKVSKPFALRKFKSADDPTLIATYDLPMADCLWRSENCAEVDFWAERPLIWISPGRLPIDAPANKSQATGILVLAENGDRLELVHDLEATARKQVVQTAAAARNRQRLYWDPKRELLYVGEGGNGFHFENATVIDPHDGATRIEALPFDAEDMCFDLDGLAYLRTTTMVVRYDPNGWREVPWDYGEDKEKVSYATTWAGSRRANVQSALPLPANAGWHHGGMHVSAKGNLVVGCLSLYGMPATAQPSGQADMGEGQKYTPKQYPGRVVTSTYGCEYIHIFDRYGKSVYADAVWGLGTVHGVAIDNEDNVYVLSSAPRVQDNKPPFNYLAGTVMKFRPGAGKIVSNSRESTLEPLKEQPQRPPDLCNLPGDAWVEGAEWMYGGVGWHGKNQGSGCGCRNTRLALDHFARTFAPEVDRYSVAVLDTNGNVITRVGTYGNVDDGVPMIAAGGPEHPRSIGGDEVSLMHAAYLATESDRRLFIADAGNSRVVSVWLGYHTEERIPIRIQATAAETGPER